MKQEDLLSEESGKEEKRALGGGGVHVRAGRAAGRQEVSHWKRELP